MAPADGSHRAMDHRTYKGPEKPTEATRGDAVVEEESAEPKVSLEQPKKGSSYGKMLLKSGLMKLEGKMGEEVWAEVLHGGHIW